MMSSLAVQGVRRSGAAITTTSGFLDNSLKCIAPGTVVPGAPTGYGNEGNWNAGNTASSGLGNHHVWELYTELGSPAAQHA